MSTRAPARPEAPPPDGGNREDSGPQPPSRLSDKALMAHLANAQAYVRRTMDEFNIDRGHICVMAKTGEQLISDTAVRSEFLRSLIDLHEFGREAKRRGLLSIASGEDKREEPAAPAVDRSTKMFAPTDNATDAVSDNASRSFFSSLDDSAPEASRNGTE
jgi:hypothetical protein